jgi:hypothetical protein
MSTISVAHPATAADKGVEGFVHSLRLSDDTVEHFDLGVATTPGGTTARLAIPLHDDSGAELGLTTRAVHSSAPCHACGREVTAKEVCRRWALRQEDWDHCPYCRAPKRKARVAWLKSQEPKYMFSSRIDHSTFLYNAHRARAALAGGGPGHCLMLCEGYADAWAFHEAGFPVVAYMGASPSQAHLRILRDLARWDASRPGDEVFCPVGVATDDDAAGCAVRDRVLGAARAWGLFPFALTSYGPGAKDAAECLSRHGALYLARAVEEARVAGA